MSYLLESFMDLRFAKVIRQEGLFKVCIREVSESLRGLAVFHFPFILGACSRRRKTACSEFTPAPVLLIANSAKTR